MLKVDSRELRRSLEEKFNEGYTYLVKITAVDYSDHVEVLYLIRDITKNADETVRAELKPSVKSVRTVVDLYPAADWYERELSEMFGIAIDGRETGRLLLENWGGKGTPLRKSFAWGTKRKGSED